MLRYLVILVALFIASSSQTTTEVATTEPATTEAAATTTREAYDWSCDCDSFTGNYTNAWNTGCLYCQRTCLNDVCTCYDEDTCDDIQDLVNTAFAIAGLTGCLCICICVIVPLICVGGIIALIVMCCVQSSKPRTTHVHMQGQQQPVQMQQPVYQQGTQQPVYQQGTQQPVYQQGTQQPVYQQGTQQPVYQQGTQQPVYQQQPVGTQQPPVVYVQQPPR